MQPRIGWLLSALMCCACGSSSDNGLFKGSGACSAPVTCTGPGFCAGHAECDSSGKPGDCVCDSSGSTGGAQNTGGASSGGSSTVESGGATSDAATVLNTGGRSLTDSGASTLDASRLTQCPTGDYDGKLTGNYTSGGGLVNADVGATVHFTVASDGSITGKYTGPSAANATLAGTVDCTTGDLSIAIKNGTYFPPAAFSGTLEGKYDPHAAKFVNGTWVITEPAAATDGGNGPWTQTS